MECQLKVTVIKGGSPVKQKPEKDKGKSGRMRKISQVSNMLLRKLSDDNRSEEVQEDKDLYIIRENLLSSDLTIHPPSFGKFEAELKLAKYIEKEKRDVVHSEKQITVWAYLKML